MTEHVRLDLSIAEDCHWSESARMRIMSSHLRACCLLPIQSLLSIHACSEILNYIWDRPIVVELIDCTPMARSSSRLFNLTGKRLFWINSSTIDCLRCIVFTASRYKTPNLSSKSYYDLLGVERTATQKEIKKAFLKLSKQVATNECRREDTLVSVDSSTILIRMQRTRPCMRNSSKSTKLSVCSASHRHVRTMIKVTRSSSTVRRSYEDLFNSRLRFTLSSFLSSSILLSSTYSFSSATGGFTVRLVQSNEQPTSSQQQWIRLVSRGVLSSVARYTSDS